MANKLFSVTDESVTFLGHTFHTTSPRPPRIIHQVPKIPTMIDGKECDPRTVLDLNGIPLQTMVWIGVQFHWTPRKV
jgi:hypothetical protein